MTKFKPTAVQEMTATAAAVRVKVYKPTLGGLYVKESLQIELLDENGEECFTLVVMPAEEKGHGERVPAPEVEIEAGVKYLTEKEGIKVA